MVGPGEEYFPVPKRKYRGKSLRTLISGLVFYVHPPFLYEFLLVLVL